MKMETPRYFTVEEANALLPEIEPLMARLLEKRAKVISLRHRLEGVVDDTVSDVGGEVASQMALDFIQIDQLIEKIEARGCVIKSVNAGLLDFLARINGRPVYLCWRYGEPKIEFYHELHTGFNGRRRL
jgi:hypothetical protein